MVEHLLAKERVESSNLFIRLIQTASPIGVRCWLFRSPTTTTSLHRSVEAIAVGPAKAHEAFTPPQTHYLLPMPQKRFEIAQGAILGPEGVLVEKTLQLDSASRLPACRTAGPRPNQRKPGASEA